MAQNFLGSERKDLLTKRNPQHITHTTDLPLWFFKCGEEEEECPVVNSM